MSLTFIIIGILTYYVTPSAFMNKNMALILLIMNIVLILFILGATLLFSFFIT